MTERPSRRAATGVCAVSFLHYYSRTIYLPYLRAAAAVSFSAKRPGFSRRSMFRIRPILAYYYYFCLVATMFLCSRPGSQAFVLRRTGFIGRSRRQGLASLTCDLVYPLHDRRIVKAGSSVVSSLRLSSSTSSSSSSPVTKKTGAKPSLRFEDTPLGKNGAHLLDGLDHYTVPAMDDGHPLSVYGISSSDPILSKDSKTLKPILLLSGRTWSSVPVYHLLGGPVNRKKYGESRSLMEALLAKGLQPYTMDFRGFGGTHPDETGTVEPYRCVHDCETVLEWISKRHGLRASDDPPALLGWSQGALVAQLAAQKAHPALSKLILYGSIYDPLVRYPREPLYRLNTPDQKVIENQFDDAIEDFTVEGTIPPEPARLFAEAALVADPIKNIWRNLYQFNNCDPARVHTPCLVIAGDQDPYCGLHVQQDLFANLGRESDRTWSILSGSDHACHLLDGRFRLINTVVSFVQNGKRTEQRGHDGY